MFLCNGGVPDSATVADQDRNQRCIQHLSQSKLNTKTPEHKAVLYKSYAKLYDWSTFCRKNRFTNTLFHKKTHLKYCITTN